MKGRIYPFIAALALTSACAQDSTRPAPPWKAVVNVLDEASHPVAGANVEVWYHVKPPPDQTDASEKISGLTDTNGTFTASHEDTRSVGLGFKITKDGYYTTSRGHQLYVPGQFDDKTVAANRNPKLTFVLNRIGQPIPMYAKWVNLGMPIFESAVGFDLMVGDWVEPHGKGVSTDFFFTGHFDKRAENESDYTLTVSFPNSGDGIQEFAVPDAEKNSGLRSPHAAPAVGYQPQWVQTDNRKPGKPVETNRDENRNYFLRVRTVLDEKGNVKSALYGKIYGDFMQFRYYLNPLPNDRNVEFDPKQNLLKGLKSFERVDAP